MRWLTDLWNYFTQPKSGVVLNDPVDLFHPKERDIYHYFDGKDVRVADPLPIYRKMKDVITDLEVEFKVAASGMQGADEHYTSAVNRIRGIFNLKSFSEGGLTEMECVTLFRHFFNYAGGVKKKLPQSSTPSPGTSESTPPSTEAVPEPSPPTEPSLGSGSTASEPTTEPPAESPSASTSPSEPSTPEWNTTEP